MKNSKMKPALVLSALLLASPAAHACGCIGPVAAQAGAVGLAPLLAVAYGARSWIKQRLDILARTLRGVGHE